jgi:hypothetical protein
MNFEQVLQFIRDPKIQRILANDSMTDWQKAADIHAMLDRDGEADFVAKTVKKPRQIKPKPEADTSTAEDQGE